MRPPAAGAVDGERRGQDEAGVADGVEAERRAGRLEQPEPRRTQLVLGVERALERAGAPVVAIVFDDEVLDEPIPVEPHDRPVAGVLTPGGGLLWFGVGAAAQR